MRRWIIKFEDSETGIECFLTNVIYTNINDAKNKLEKFRNSTNSSTIHHSIVEMVDVNSLKYECDMTDSERDDFRREIDEISKDLQNLISFDEWSAREYGNANIDTYDTALALYNAGYRKVRTPLE